MKKKIIELDSKEINELKEQHCKYHKWKYCYGCPLDIEGKCYPDVKLLLEKEVEVEI